MPLISRRMGENARVAQRRAAREQRGQDRQNVPAPGEDLRDLGTLPLQALYQSLAAAKPRGGPRCAWTREELLLCGIAWHRECGVLPCDTDLLKSLSMPSNTSVRRMFGSLEAYREALQDALAQQKESV